MEFKPVSTIPPVQRGSKNSKYREIIEAAIEHGTVEVSFEDVKTAHSRAGSVRTVAQGFEEDIKVTVRGSNIYVTTDEDEVAKLTRAPRKKAVKKATAKKAAKKAGKKRPSKKTETEDLDEADLS